jgi:hypothetical protein
VAGDRDTLELYLEGMTLPPERLEGLAREVEGVFRRYLEVAAYRPSPPARPLPPDPG